MKKFFFFVGIGALFGLLFLYTFSSNKKSEYDYWMDEFRILSPKIENNQLSSSLISSWDIQKIPLSYPLLDWLSSLYFCQSWLYVRFNHDFKIDQVFLSGFFAMRTKRLGNFYTRSNAPEFGTYYSLSWVLLSGNMFDIINGENSYYQVQWYHIKDFVYDSKVQEYFCLSPDDQTKKYFYILDNLYQNPSLPLSFYTYFFSLAEQQEWQKIKDLIVVLQKKWYSPLPFGRRYFDNKDWYLNAVSLENHWILLEYNIAWKKQQYSLYYSDGYFFLITFFQKTTLK